MELVAHRTAQVYSSYWAVSGYCEQCLHYTVFPQDLSLAPSTKGASVLKGPVVAGSIAVVVEERGADVARWALGSIGADGVAAMEDRRVHRKRMDYRSIVVNIVGDVVRGESGYCKAKDMLLLQMKAL